MLRNWARFGKVAGTDKSLVSAKSVVVGGFAQALRLANVPHGVVCGHGGIARVRRPGWGARRGLGGTLLGVRFVFAGVVRVGGLGRLWWAVVA